jgi:hypothetical protein
MDWHHRRNSMAMYWRQQKGYGKAEALLEEKWPERYNAFGHLNWSGRLYGRGFAFPIPFGGRACMAVSGERRRISRSTSRARSRCSRFR